MAPCDAQAEIKRLTERVAQLTRALEATLSKWVTLVESGDAGNWDPEKEPHVIAARAALEVGVEDITPSGGCGG